MKNSNIIGLTIAPIFFTAALYVTLARVIRHFGTHNSMLSPRAYTAIFLSFDLISLVLQSVGGGMANMATTRASSIHGVRVMVIGLALQVLSMVVFMIICINFSMNVRRDRVQQQVSNWAAGKVDPPTEHVSGYAGFVWGTFFQFLC